MIRTGYSGRHPRSLLLLRGVPGLHRVPRLHRVAGLRGAPERPAVGDGDSSLVSVYGVLAGSDQQVVVLDARADRVDQVLTCAEQLGPDPGQLVVPDVKRGHDGLVGATAGLACLWPG